MNINVNGCSMTVVNPETKKADALLWEYTHCYKGKTLSDVYSTCSCRKIESFNNIRMRCFETEGYNKDLKITGSNCDTYSTMYTFTNADGTFLVKDTYCNTFILKIE